MDVKGSSWKTQMAINLINNFIFKSVSLNKFNEQYLFEYFSCIVENYKSDALLNHALIFV